VAASEACAGAGCGGGPLSLPVPWSVPGEGVTSASSPLHTMCAYGSWNKVAHALDKKNTQNKTKKEKIKN